MLYLILILQLLILVFFFYSINNNKNKKDSTITKKELIEWQNVIIEILQEAETLAKELRKTLEKKSKEIDDKIKKLDKKLKKVEEITPPFNEITSKPISKPQWETISPKIIQEQKTKSKLPKEYHEIYQLADEGLNIVDIAKRTNIGKGEIQLILDLRKKNTLQ